jgi:hypothetical protein
MWRVEKPIMMSGPAPEFSHRGLLVDVFHPEVDRLTSMPVFRNFASRGTRPLVSLTKRTGRSMRKDAPFSIANFGAGTSAALMVDAVCAEAPVAANAAAEAPKASASRRVMSFFMLLSLFWFPALNRR